MIFNAICSFRREKTAAILLELQNRLTTACDSIEDVRLFLTDLYLLIKERTNHLYGGSKVNFPGNADIIREIQHKQYLYEIIGMFTMQFESIISVIGVSSSDTVVDEVLDYMEHHYMENIKLEGIAPLFGYNSSYLGKLFSRKVGENFNLHLDRIRIEHAKDILRREDMKVYEIAENIGYNNVDYFHIKFKRFVGTTPAEYRKNYGETTA
jgi:two-component system response regulator YesN